MSERLIFENTLILGQILKHLTMKDLKNVQQINSIWRELSQCAIKRRIVNFSQISDFVNFVHNRNLESQEIEDITFQGTVAAIDLTALHSILSWLKVNGHRLRKLQFLDLEHNLVNALTQEEFGILQQIMNSLCNLEELTLLGEYTVEDGMESRQLILPGAMRSVRKLTIGLYGNKVRELCVRLNLSFRVGLCLHEAFPGVENVVFKSNRDLPPFTNEVTRWQNHAQAYIMELFHYGNIFIHLRHMHFVYDQQEYIYLSIRLLTNWFYIQPRLESLTISQIPTSKNESKSFYYMEENLTLMKDTLNCFRLNLKQRTLEDSYFHLIIPPEIKESTKLEITLTPHNFDNERKKLVLNVPPNYKNKRTILLVKDKECVQKLAMFDDYISVEEYEGKFVNSEESGFYVSMDSLSHYKCIGESKSQVDEAGAAVD